ncbi:MAG: hypothetical protein EBQ80_00275 [Proteobacteria bacterium]|nr:hypothetical protein [Pseudomonadota bacterium]
MLRLILQAFLHEKSACQPSSCAQPATIINMPRHRKRHPPTQIGLTAAPAAGISASAGTVAEWLKAAVC